MRQKSVGFTLIELLVSTTIILLLILFTVPSYDRVRSKNLLETNGQKIQGCFMKTKALALAPEREVKNLEYYGLTVYSEKKSASPNQCLVQFKTKIDDDSQTIDDLQTIETISIPAEVAIVLPNGAAEHSFKFSPELRGGLEDDPGSPSTIILKDDNNRCLNLNISKTVGEITFGKIGEIDIINEEQCIEP